MNCCLNKDELKVLLDYKIYNREIEDEDIYMNIMNAEQYLNPLKSLTYFLAKVMEQFTDQIDVKNAFVSKFFNLPNEIYFEFNELNPEFIEYVIKCERDRRVVLDDDLINKFNDFSSHYYAKIIRH